MLNPRLTNCVECTEVPSLLQDIDCKMADLANSLYDNVVFSLNRKVALELMLDLSHYKRILMYKVTNPDYASEYTLTMIVSKVKLLKFK